MLSHSYMRGLVKQAGAVARIRAALSLLGLSLVDLAERAGVSYGTARVALSRPDVNPGTLQRLEKTLTDIE